MANELRTGDEETPVVDDVAQRTLARRSILSGAAIAAAAGVTLLTSGSAEAATTVVKTVRQDVVLTYRYNATTRATVVTKCRTRRVTVRLVGTAVQLKNAKGVWTRIPYVWSRARQRLVYDHYLHLRLMAAARPPTPKPPTPPPPAPTPAPSSTNPYLSDDAAWHLLRRASWGVSAASLADVSRLGIEGWVDWQLAPSAIDDAACDAVLSRLPAQSDPIWQVNGDIQSGAREGWQQMQSVLTGHAIRAMWSRRQLQSVMDDFWGNHFNVTCPHDNVEESRAHYSATIRDGAFGSFADLLWNVTKHPAMLTYLNNRDSDLLHPNENQGRELLELHTVGIDAGYGEEGVLNSARLLTGLSVSYDSGEFLYKPWKHWTGAVTVLDFTTANATKSAGLVVAESYVRHLAHHPATAHRLALKLVRHFVSDDPPEPLVTALAVTYLANDTAIAPMLRQLLLSDEFRASIGQKFARPFEQIAATVRLLDIAPDRAPSVDGIQALVWQAGAAGHSPFGWAFPTGYADVAAAWSSTGVTLTNWNTTRALVEGWWPNSLVAPELATWLFGSTLPATHGEAVNVVARRLFGRALAPKHVAAALAFLGVGAGDRVTADSGVASWEAGGLVSLLLDSPYFQCR